MKKRWNYKLRSMIWIYLFIFLTGSIFAAVGNALAQTQPSGDINIFFGYKNLDEDDWDPVDQHTEFGVDFDIQPPNWPVSLAFGYLKSSDDDTFLGIDVEGETSELYFGVRKVFEANPVVRPFVGAGLVNVSAEFTGSRGGISVSDDDSAIGIWVGGGLYITLAEHLNLGFSMMYSQAEVTLFDVDGEGGGLHYGVLLGYHW